MCTRVQCRHVNSKFAIHRYVMCELAILHPPLVCAQIQWSSLFSLHHVTSQVILFNLRSHLFHRFLPFHICDLIMTVRSSFKIFFWNLWDLRKNTVVDLCDQTLLHATLFNNSSINLCDCKVFHHHSFSRFQPVMQPFTFSRLCDSWFNMNILKTPWKPLTQIPFHWSINSEISKKILLKKLACHKSHNHTGFISHG